MPYFCIVIAIGIFLVFVNNLFLSLLQATVVCLIGFRIVEILDETARRRTLLGRLLHCLWSGNGKVTPTVTIPCCTAMWCNWEDLLLLFSFL